MKIIKELMTDKSHSCGSNESIEQAAEKMSRAKLNSIVVLNEKEIVVGTLSYLDVCMASIQTKKTGSEIKVAEIMSTNTFTISTHDDETLALNLMRQFHINTLPVVDEENKLRGTIRFITLARRIISFRKKFKLPALNPFHPELA